MILKRKLRIQIYNSAETEVEYDSDIDTTWGITAGSASLESLIMEEELRYGDLNSSIFQVQVFNINADISKRKIVVTVNDEEDTQSYIVDDQGNYLIDDAENRIVGTDGIIETHRKIFTGWIDSAKQDHSGIYRDIIAYDWIHYHRENNIASWWNTFWEQSGDTVALSVIRDSLLTYMGVDTDIPSTLINDNLLIKNNLVNATSITTLKFETVMQMICILQNVSPHINGDGELTLIHLGSTTTDVTDNLETENSIYEDYITNPITGIAVYDTSDNLVQVVGTDTNVYKIIGNLFLLNLTAQELTNACTPLLNDLATVRYTPASLSLIISNLDYELGNKFQTDKGTTYAFRTQIYGSLFVNQVLESFAFGANLNPDVYSENEDLMVGNKIARIDKNIDGLNIQFADLERNVSTEIGILADEIVMKVDLSGNMVEVALGEDPSSSGATIFKVTADNVDFIANNNMQLTAKNLGITSDNFSVTPAGAITSKSGTIGGWTINANSILKAVTISGVEYAPMLYAPTNPSATSIAFCVRRVEAGQTTYPFLVRYNGQLESTAGKIGAWNITSTGLYSEYISGNNGYRVTIRTNQGNTTDGAIYIRTTTDGGSSYTYPFVVRYDGTFIAEKATITGAITTTSLKIDNKANLSVVNRSISQSDFTITNTSVVSSADAIVVPVLQISSGYGMYIPSVTEFGNYVSLKRTSVYGKLDVNGDMYASQNMFVQGWAHFQGQIIATQSIELFNTQDPESYLDFHYNSTTFNHDYDARIMCDNYAQLSCNGRDSNGDVVGCDLRAKSFVVWSSKHIKKNIKNITKTEARKLLDLRPVSFDYKYMDVPNQRGLIAEEVLEVMPEMVNVPEGYDEFDSKKPLNTLSIDYAKFVPYLIKMVQIQQKEIDTLKKSIK